MLRCFETRERLTVKFVAPRKHRVILELAPIAANYVHPDNRSEQKLRTIEGNAEFVVFSHIPSSAAGWTYESVTIRDKTASDPIHSKGSADPHNHL